MQDDTRTPQTDDEIYSHEECETAKLIEQWGE